MACDYPMAIVEFYSIDLWNIYELFLYKNRKI